MTRVGDTAARAVGLTKRAAVRASNRSPLVVALPVGAVTVGALHGTIALAQSNSDFRSYLEYAAQRDGSVVAGLGIVAGIAAIATHSRTTPEGRAAFVQSVRAEARPAAFVGGAFALAGGGAASLELVTHATSLTPTAADAITLGGSVAAVAATASIAAGSIIRSRARHATPPSRPSRTGEALS